MFNQIDIFVIMIGNTNINTNAFNNETNTIINRYRLSLNR